MSDESCFWTLEKLEVLFAEKFGEASGNRALDHDGFRIRRSVRRLPSNSGKSHTWRVDYTIYDADGRVVQAIGDPNKSLNRASDPNRNWGMKRGG
jgi:hypothetical protein